MNDEDKRQLLASLAKNKRQISMAIEHLNSFHVRSVKKGTKINELDLDNIFAKMLLPQWVALLEIEFNILVCRHAQFDILKQTSVLRRKPEVEKWILLVECAFREAYAVNEKRPLNSRTLGDTTYYRYQKIVTTIKDDIGPYIQLRNRLAHGQWAIAFNETGQGQNADLTQKAWTLSKKDLMLIKIFIKNLPLLLNELAISKVGFEKSYDKYMHRMNIVKIDIDDRFRTLLSRGTGPL